MRLTLLPLALAGLGLAPAFADTEQRRDLADFDRIEIKGALELQVTIAERYDVRVSADDRYIDDVETDVRDGRLVISMRARDRWNDADVVVKIQMPKLAALDVSGAVDADLDGLDEERLEIDISGAADLDARGRCGTLELTVNGAGEIDAEDLHCETVTAIINGAGEASVHASRKVTARVNGVGEIDIYGNPQETDTRDTWLSEITVHR